MKEKKNIDNLFKERFQNFEAAPSPEVWNQLEAKLQEKKKERRVIPLWWRVAGVAALLALLFTVGISLFNSNQNTTPQLVEENVHPSEEQLATPLKDAVHQQTGIEDAVVTENSKTQTYSDTKEQDPIGSQEKEVSVSKSALSETTIKTSEEKQNRTTNNYKQPQPKKASTPYNTEKEAVAITKDANKPSSSSSETTQNPLVKDAQTVVSEKEAVAKNNTKTPQGTKVKDEGLFNLDKGIVPTEKETETAIAKTEKETTEQSKKSIFDAIEENKQLEDAVVKKEMSSNRWAVTPNAGPVYYSSLNGGSSIDPMFSDNSQSGDVNLSYGVQVSYDVSDKIAIRSGINNVNLSYATGDLEIASAPLALGLKNIDYGANRNTITTVFDKGSIGSSMGPSTEGLGAVTPKSTGGNAELSQRISYYEVPLELKYAVLDTKFGINVVGGMSTLFLGTNEIVVNDGDFRTVLGEANNLNSISFTTNIGLGFNYQLSKKFKFNIEPMFKYQLNPYTNSSVGFKPYYLGVYSGLSFKF